MLTTIEDINFTRQVETALLAYTKEVKELTYVEHGTDNVVAMVNKEFVFRFPRNEVAAQRIVFETALFQEIKDKISVVPIPHLLEVHTRPLYIVSKYISGEHLTNAQINTLDEEDQSAIGRTLGVFMHELNQAVSGLEIRRLRTAANLESSTEPWPTYFQRLFTRPLPNEKLRPVVGQYYNLWKEYVRSEANTYAIHDDLNPNNILFSGPRVAGVLDFGEANTGSIESELRKLYGTGDIVLKAAISQYENLAKMTINYDHVRVWAVVQELARFVDRLARQQTTTPMFLQAQANLRQWVTNFPL